jgi:glycosyltransferase involved in cell wall biosynthesis
MAECARKCVVLAGADVRVIPYALNVEGFSPRDRREARRSLGWATDGRVVLAGAMGIDSGERKGVRDFWQALGLLAERLAPQSLPRVVVFGTAQRREVRVGRLLVSELGYVSDESNLADIYAAADIFVASSKEDNLPNTVMEALAVGVPVVGSRVGGIPDMVEHEVNGLLVEPGNAAEMSFAMLRLLTDKRLRALCASAAREKALRCYSPAVIVRAHNALYREIGGGL